MVWAYLSIPNFFIDCIIDNGLADSDLKPETKETLLKLNDSTTIYAVTSGPAGFIEKIADPPLHTDVKSEEVNLGWEKTGEGFDEWKATPGAVTQITHDVSSKFSTVILGEDDLFSKYTFMEKLMGRAMRNRFLLPLEDSKVMIKNDESAAALLSDLDLVEGKAIPLNYNTDFNMLTDESFSRIFFNGMGSVLLANQKEVSASEFGPFVVDMPYHELQVRRHYREYGARVHFSEDQKVTAIYDYKWEKLVQPGESGWDEAKMLAKMTAFTLMTVREHLTWSHLICSNDATRESTLNLAPSHPIRRLLTVFSFHATEVNLHAFNSLVPNTSLLHRAVGLKYASMQDMFDVSYTTCNIYEPFSQRTYNPALQKLADEGKLPYISEGSQYYEIVKTFVRSWLDEAGEAATSDKQATAFYGAMKKSTEGQKYELPELSHEDAMVNLLASIIFTVTAYHELIGCVVDYTELPSRAGFRLTKDDPSKIDLQSFVCASLITASTSVSMPKLMSEFPNFFGAKGAPDWEVGVWKNFQGMLEEQSKKVQKADKKREVEFKYFDPARFECSISV